MMEYRLATPQDAPRLAQMRWDYQTENKKNPEGKEKFLLYCATYLQEALAKEYACWVAVEDELIVSHIYIATVRKIPKPTKLDGIWGYVTAVYTVPEYRSRGIGTALMEEAKAWSRTVGLEHLIVWPSKHSVPFYERAEFLDENGVMELPLD